jgi:hypothetical protein
MLIGNGANTATDAATLAGGATAVATVESYARGWDPVAGVYTRAYVDACEANQQTSTPISMTTATTLRIVAPSASKKTYICGLFLISAIANNVAIVEGTGGTCGTGTAGVIGGTTAANGVNAAANGGFVLPAGKVAQAITVGTNVDLCLITSSAGPLTGVIKWAQQ